MRAVVQRVSEASVEVAGETVGEIGRGLLVLVGVAPEDGEREAEVLAEKLVALRIFSDDEGKMNRSVVDVGGSMLVVSQFTVLGSVLRGRRPSFTGAAAPDAARTVVDAVVEAIATTGVEVATGHFGASMTVRLVNDGPVTLVVDVSEGRVV